MTQPVTSKSIVRSGLVAGIAGGLAIAAVGMVLGALLGTGFWSLPNAIGGIALGPTAGATRDFGLITLVGVMLHMGLSAGYGVFTRGVIRYLTREHLLTAVAAAIALWVVNYYVIGAFVPGARAMAALNPVWMALGLHVLFGAVVGVVSRTLDRS